MYKLIKFGFSIAVFVIIASCTKDPGQGKLEGENSGGATTVFVSNSKAFATPAPNLTNEHLELHLKGDAAFESKFVAGPAPKNQGLGSIFNNNSCISCHPADGRASLPSDINSLSGFFYKISLPGADLNGGPLPVPGFGTQLQHQAIYGYEKEAAMYVEYEEVPVVLEGGETVYLQKPTYSITNAYIEMPQEVLISPRIGMPVFGLGLLEAIKLEDILAHSDPDDLDGDSISGHPNYVWNVRSGGLTLGRFGWKAGTSSVLIQTAGAYNEDMGITNPIRSTESSFGQSNSNGTSQLPELSQEILDAVTFYSMTLGVPAARNFDDAEVIKGNQVFNQLQCAGCHNPSFTTGEYKGIPEISNQKIYPYTDMLLHDMGEGLADNRPEFDASGSEWKTRPLWGIGLTALTSGQTNFLHDGRARTITEAILWHGGEAENSTRNFKKLSPDDREALLKFINSL